LQLLDHRDGHVSGAKKVSLTRRKSAGPREIELKLRLPAGGRAILEAEPSFAAAKSQELHLITTYFDTADCLLDGLGLSLRVRQLGDSRIQTVKSHARAESIASTRGEWEWPVRQDTPDVSLLMQIMELANVARLIKGRLLPVFITDIRRTTRLLVVGGSTVVEASIDEGSIAADAVCEPVSELELELKSGAVEQLYRLAAALQAQTPLWLSPESKAARGWRLRTGQLESPQSARPLKLVRRVRVVDGLYRIIDGTLGQLRANIEPALRGDAEGLHQLRIAICQLRAALKLFKHHLNREPAKQFDSRLQRFERLFGGARDWDVFCLETLPKAIVDLPSSRLQDLVPVAEVARRTAHAVTDEAVRGQDFTALVLAMAVWMEAGAARTRTLGDKHLDSRLGGLAPSLLDPVSRKVQRRSRHVGRHSVEALHSLRKSLKRLCFDVDFLAGLYPARAVTTYRQTCNTVEDILSLANDSSVTRELAISLSANSRPELAQPIGLLLRWSDHRSCQALLGLKSALHAFHTVRRFW
jgi:triphosphatase